MGSLELWLHFVGIFGRVFIKKQKIIYMYL